MKPATDIIAGRSTTVDDLVMAAAAAHVARPTGTAGFLAVHMALIEPRSALRWVSTGEDVAHGAGWVLDETMAGKQSALRRDAKIAGACTTRIRTVCAFVNLTQRSMYVGKCEAPTGVNVALELPPTGDHRREHCAQVGRRHLVLACGRAEHGEKPTL